MRKWTCQEIYLRINWLMLYGMQAYDVVCCFSLQIYKITVRKVLGSMQV